MYSSTEQLLESAEKTKEAMKELTHGATDTANAVQTQTLQTEEIQKKVEEYTLQRKTKQPLEYGSAGSTFKRPEGYFAGKLIQDAGLRGYTVGGAQVSEKHCGFVINKDNATATDVLQVIRDVQNIVKEKYGLVKYYGLDSARATLNAGLETGSKYIATDTGLTYIFQAYYKSKTNKTIVWIVP